MRSFLAIALLAPCLLAGPVEFGNQELRRAILDRGLDPARLRYKAEMTTDPPETWRIVPGRVTGGDLRGLMYGLLEAADQIRSTGHLAIAKGAPATPIRGIRYFLHNEDLEKEWYYSHEYWTAYFRMLARNRFNRFNLVFAHQTAYLAPPYPFWFEVPEFPGVRVPGLTAAARDRNLEMLRFISQTATEYAIDFTLGIWEHNIQPRMKPSVEGLTRENIGPYSYAALKKVLAACPTIRSVQMRTNSESGIPGDQQVEFYRDWVFRAIREAGRRVTLDLRGWLMQQGLMDAALNSGAPLRLSSKYWAEDLGRPYQPAETFANYSYLNFLEKPAGKPRPYDFYWEIWGLGSNRLLLWGDPDFVRRAVPTFALSGSAGFEIDPPLAQKGFGNAPGTWGIFTPEQKDRVFWKYEFERYWMFYTLWGRLSYDPQTSEKVWMSQLQKRFGDAAPDVMEAYRYSSRVLPEIVAVHLADPNMYIWPEINPGGLVDAYKDVRPSDWSMVASIPEAVRNRIDGIASAKQTPVMTAARLHDMAARTDQAVARAKARLSASVEWRGSEPDFQVLAALAHYHARKQLAADQIAWFDQTGDITSLETAQRELRGALRLWEDLVKLTDGLYPPNMAFGPDDIGHWKDKLPYVQHDLKLVADRKKIFEKYGRFDFGFDFGGPVNRGPGAGYRNDPFITGNTVAPRLLPVSSATKFNLEAGYGWAADGTREDAALPVTPYAEVRATAENPAHLPENVLYGDSIRGDGPQVFRVRTSDGEYTVYFLQPDGNDTRKTLQAAGGVLDIVFPESSWNCAGLVVKSARTPSALPVQSWPKALVRPQIAHVAPKTAPPNRPLALAIHITPLTHITSVRLHYRAVNQLVKFKTIDASPSKGTFIIPASEVSGKWDLMYYFEVLNSEKSGWFSPDPSVATPYHVVKIEEPKQEPAAPAAP